METMPITAFGIEELEPRRETTWYYWYCSSLIYFGIVSGYHRAYAVCWYYWA